MDGTCSVCFPKTGVDWFVWWRRSDCCGESWHTHSWSFYVLVQRVSCRADKQNQSSVFLPHMRKKTQLKAPVWSRLFLWDMLKPSKYVFVFSVLKTNAVKDTKRCLLCRAAGCQLLASSPDGPGVHWSSSAWVKRWEPEVGRAKRGNSGPVPFSTFNERCDHAGVKVQVEQFSACTHARCSVLAFNERVKNRVEKTSQGIIFLNAWRIILPSQVSSPSLPSGDDGFEMRTNKRLHMRFCACCCCCCVASMNYSHFKMMRNWCSLYTSVF